MIQLNHSLKNKMPDLKQAIRRKQKELAELVSEIKAKERFRARTKLERLALKLARESKEQIIYGSVAARAYQRTIRPRDIDITTPSPYKMARKLKEEALKRGIKAKLKKKYIKQIKAHIYEVNSISYSPLQKKKLKEAIVKDRLRQTGLVTEVKALAGTIARTQAQYRARRDYLKLRRIKLLLEKKKRERFKEVIAQLKKQGESFFLNVLESPEIPIKARGKQKWL